ncbi:lytic transglycosylase domain-containing protein [Streptomyces sp. UNOC14_S4]|uniref:lytic transglycosylase domain-containing protein n=1 Tax=Streptomyces sp. UNOC14_S4 TaxID=2872340 RepID=UPI001E34AEBF|nr:lytic transglycosylase domain-containing protein [Streptomyces sp. UNOC14_S4]MCC3772213.1 lytic transglycosylase domain-containing protein [Streptomyces sp. UNOC14_S4]
MKILPTRAASVSRQGLCTALLVASLTAAVGVSPPHNTADADEPTPGSETPQGKPHGTPNLTLPDLKPHGPGAPGTPGDNRPDGQTGIPAIALDAYRKAEETAKKELPNCHIPWQLIAGIGKVESDHGTIYGTHLTADGTTDKPILGPQLTGKEFALVKDTDGGFWDGDKDYDRAVGPMQFIPSTWKQIGKDGNGGYKNPNNIYDASVATARYLCEGGKDMGRSDDLRKAILSYNNSSEYVKAVTEWMRAYQSGVAELPDVPATGSPTRPGSMPPPSTMPTTPTPSRPSQPSQPTQPSQPSRPSQPGGGGQKPGGGGGNNGDKPTPPAPTTARITRLGGGEWEAVTGDTFTQQASVRTTTSAGKPTKGTRVRFEIIGKTGARFPGKGTVFTTTTDKDGTASAPAILAGDQVGTFTVRAKVENIDALSVDYAATVKPVPVDTLKRADGDKAIVAAPNASFAENLQIEALGRGKALAGVALTATVTAVDGKTDMPDGPYFKDATGAKVHTIALGQTDDKGLVALPKLFTDAKVGSFMLRITTADGKKLLLPLRVEQPEVTTTPGATPATPSASATPSAPAARKK